MQVYFVGAGPGDPDLITVKGAQLLGEADIIIYAGSLVNPALLKYARKDAEVHNSASMTLEEVLAVMDRAAAEGKTVVRLHTGDPSLYGAIQEQIDALEKRGMTYTVIPGVSSFAATAAALKRELTLPGVTQTVILTRQGGRTEVPEGETLGELARHRATMCIFLSVQSIDEVARELSVSYPLDTPVAVVQKASWPEQRIVGGTLADISGKVKEAGITKTAMIVVGDIFRGEYELSRLYDRSFSHEYRRASVEPGDSGPD